MRFIYACICTCNMHETLYILLQNIFISDLEQKVSSINISYCKVCYDVYKTRMFSICSCKILEKGVCLMSPKFNFIYIMELKLI